MRLNICLSNTPHLLTQAQRDVILGLAEPDPAHRMSLAAAKKRLERPSLSWLICPIRLPWLSSDSAVVPT